MVKALRAFQMYLPNNPIYQRASENLRHALSSRSGRCSTSWCCTVAETEFVWEEQVVYHQLNKSESLALGPVQGRHALADDPARRGAGGAATRFLETINRARFLPADAGDDLLTLLWEQEFEFIQYRFIEFFRRGWRRAMPEASRHRRPVRRRDAPRERRARPPRRPPPRAQGRGRHRGVRLHALLPGRGARSTSWPRRVEEEYQRDVRGSALNVLFDLFELRPSRTSATRSSACSSALFPNLLNARDFRTAAAVLRESKLLDEAGARTRSRSRSQRLDGFVAKLSEPAIVGQLLQSLDEASRARRARPRCRRGAARAPRDGAGAAAQLASESRLRAAAQDAGGRGRPAGRQPPGRGPAHPRSPESRRCVGGGRLCGRLQLHPGRARDSARPSAHPDPAVRLAAVQTLAQLGTPRR